MKYKIYGGSGYNQSWNMEATFQGANLTAAQKAFDMTIFRVGIYVEWVFKEKKMYFAEMDYKRKMKVNEPPVELLYLSVMLFCNFSNCIYLNQVAK